MGYWLEGVYGGKGRRPAQSKSREEQDLANGTNRRPESNPTSPSWDVDQDDSVGNDVATVDDMSVLSAFLGGGEHALWKQLTGLGSTTTSSSTQQSPDEEARRRRALLVANFSKSSSVPIPKETDEDNNKEDELERGISQEEDPADRGTSTSTEEDTQTTTDPSS